MKKSEEAFSDRKKAVQHVMHSFVFFLAAFLLAEEGRVTLPVPVIRFPARVRHRAAL